MVRPDPLLGHVRSLHRRVGHARSDVESDIVVPGHVRSKRLSVRPAAGILLDVPRWNEQVYRLLLPKHLRSLRRSVDRPAHDREPVLLPECPPDLDADRVRRRENLRRPRRRRDEVLRRRRRGVAGAVPQDLRRVRRSDSLAKHGGAAPRAVARAVARAEALADARAIVRPERRADVDAVVDPDVA